MTMDKYLLQKFSTRKTKMEQIRSRTQAEFI